MAKAKVAHADETGININGNRHWLNCTSNEAWTHYYPHAKRSTLAMDEVGILPRFKGILCRDHWKPYYRYDTLYSLCNAHHLRELACAWEQDQQMWAHEMGQFLCDLNNVVDEAGGGLSDVIARQYVSDYRKILRTANHECPPPEQPPGKPKRGRLKRSKSRNLLERLITYDS